MTFKPASTFAVSTALSVSIASALGAPAALALPQSRPNQRASVRPVTAQDLATSAADDWLTYHGSYTGHHYSTLAQVTTRTVARLRRAWVSDTDAPAAAARGAGSGARPGSRTPPVPIPAGRTGVGRGSAPGGAIASAPIVRNGVLFYTLGINAYALDARTGRQIWHYTARSSGGLSNRGLAIGGDALFMMANGGLTAIDAATGEERWVKEIGGPVSANAPFVVRDHVYVVSGSDGGSSRSWIESRNARTGEREWIWYAIPKEGEFGFNTWPSEDQASRGAGTPWQPPTYDPEQNLLIFGTGNPDPIRDGRARPGDNLFTNCVVALDADTGAMKWYFQATPHDDHDYDNNQSMSLANITVAGQPRRVVTWTARNGYFFTLDRTTGENLVTARVFANTNWAFERLRSSGTPEPIQNKSGSRGGSLLSPSSEGVVNYPSQSFSPQTGLHYSNIVNSYSVFYWSGESFLGTFRNALRATDPATGKVAWQHDYLEPYGIHARYPSVLSTAGGLLFTGDISGNFVAFDATTGKILWHDELPEASVTGVPVSYLIDGGQYVAVPTGTKIVAYRLP
jgi:alcohol dehydrogenase (cytochrome c)